LPDDLRSLHLAPEPADPGGVAGDAARRTAPRKRPAPAARRQPDDDPARDEAIEFDAEEPGPALRRQPPDHGSAPFDVPDPGFHIDDDLFSPIPAAAGPDAFTAPFLFDGGDPAGGQPAAAGPDWHTELRLAAGPETAGAGEEPIIDRDDEVPEQFWAPTVAGLGRRAVALVVDQALLAALLALFAAGAWGALRLDGFDAGVLFTRPGLAAALPGFALLALLLSLVYHAYFHGRAGSTPGKALAGVEVRTADGAVPSWGRATLRWFAAALGAGCAGVGVAWALFEPRRRGWADLLSATVIAERRAGRAATPRR
jgi:uncharacterized RDD family membrane protein YckC